MKSLYELFFWMLTFFALLGTLHVGAERSIESISEQEFATCVSYWNEQRTKILVDQNVVLYGLFMQATEGASTPDNNPLLPGMGSVDKGKQAEWQKHTDDHKKPEEAKSDFCKQINRLKADKEKEKEFTSCVSYMQTWLNSPLVLEQLEKVKAYGLHMQATVGDNKTAKPKTESASLDVQKWDEWKNRYGMTKEVAKSWFCEYINELKQKELTSCLPYDQNWYNDQSTPHMMKLYGLLMQATVGDYISENNPVRPEMGSVDKEKLAEWQKCKGMTKEEAKSALCELVESLNEKYGFKKN